MTPTLAGHLLVECLVEQGITHAFGVPGESYLAVLDGFHEHAGQIRFVACRQEGGAAFMAEAQGKLIDDRDMSRVREKRVNEKTGDMDQLYILPDTGQTPAQSWKSGDYASVCGNCTHRVNDTCYVVRVQGSRAIYAKYQRGGYPTLDPASLPKTRAIRLGADGDLDGAVLLFASEASSFITGQILHVDGGKSCGARVATTL